MEACIKECNSLLSTFRTEERRRVSVQHCSCNVIESSQVLGGKPVENLCHLRTPALTANIMAYLKATEEVKQTYTRHLALLVSVTKKTTSNLTFTQCHNFNLIQRQYVRSVPSCSSERNVYAGYGKWSEEEHIDLTEEFWGNVMLEDDDHPYDTNPITSPCVLARFPLLRLSHRSGDTVPVDNCRSFTMNVPSFFTISLPFAVAQIIPCTL